MRTACALASSAGKSGIRAVCICMKLSWAGEVEIDGVIASADVVEVNVDVDINGGTSKWLSLFSFQLWLYWPS